ncbi:MAG: DUF2088 domain-containing protein [Sedimentisphaerales bacterium]|nr:DUF2088 domain-containing protein [Sedimentisphaerales bacterium]
MSDIQLHYGPGFVPLCIPEENAATFFRPGQSNSVPETVVWETILGREPYFRFCREVKDRHLCILLEDGTRDLPLESVLPHICSSLFGCRQVRFLLCTGTHNADTKENRYIIAQLQGLISQSCLRHVDILVHDCTSAKFLDAGYTPERTPILYNSVIRDAEMFLVLSDVKPHYFAGYSNPVKNFVPGLCAYSTTEKNHSLALDERSTYGIHPWHPDSARRDNPLACDQVEAMGRIVGSRPVWALVMISTAGQMQWADFGPVQEVTGRAFVQTDLRNSFTVTPQPYLIVSPGGLPNDVDLYIAQRALELTKNAVTDGGQVLFLSACPRGVGEAHTRAEFYDRLTKPLDVILSDIDRAYKLFSHKPYKFAQMIQRLAKLWVYSDIPDEQLSAAHLNPVSNPQTIIDHWLQEDPAAQINIVDGANKVALYLPHGNRRIGQGKST